MPRPRRCVLPGVPCHITQRGVDRRETFSSDTDRRTYLGLLQQDLEDTGVALLGWCLMTNPVHLIALPLREDSLSILLRRAHGRYAQYYNACSGRTGHLWQNRFFSCVLAPDHLWTALAYAECNPVRAGIVKQARDYAWSSALAHITGHDERRLLDMEWWQREQRTDWEQHLRAASLRSDQALRAATYAGRPFGSDDFLREMAEKFDRHWTDVPAIRPVRASVSLGTTRECGNHLACRVCNPRIDRGLILQAESYCMILAIAFRASLRITVFLSVSNFLSSGRDRLDFIFPRAITACSFTSGSSSRFSATSSAL